MTTQRMTGSRDELDALWGTINNLLMQTYYSFVVGVLPAVGNGGTAGNLRTTASVDYNIGLAGGGTLASTDDLWDLSAEVDTLASQWRAYWLYNDGTFDAGGIASSGVSALAGLPIPDPAKSIIGTYTAGPLTDFDDGGGLAAQGTIADGVPSGAGPARGSNGTEPTQLVAP